MSLREAALSGLDGDDAGKVTSICIKLGFDYCCSSPIYSPTIINFHAAFILQDYFVSKVSL